MAQPPGPEQESVRDRMLRDLPALEKTVTEKDAAAPPLVSSGAMSDRAFSLLCAMTPEVRARGGYQQVADRLGKSVATLHQWAERYEWPRKLAEHDQKMAQLARESAALKIADRSSRLTEDLYSMGQQCLVVANSVFMEFVDAQTGKLKKPVAITEVPDIIKVGLLCAQAGADLASAIGLTPGGQPMDATAWSTALANAQPSQKLVMLQGLKAAKTLRAGKEA